MMHALKKAYGWILFQLMFRGPLFLWEGKNGWTPLALYFIGWAGYWAHAPSPAKWLKMVTEERDALRIELRTATEALETGGYTRCVGPAGWKPAVNRHAGEMIQRLMEAEKQLDWERSRRKELEHYYKLVGKEAGWLDSENDAIWIERILNLIRRKIGIANDAVSTGTAAAFDVLGERRRQVEKEGWSDSHDDTHETGEMARAAGCYAICASDHDYLTGRQRVDKGAPGSWPWDAKWWKPTDRRRDLVKAGALILAEIERLDRAAAKAGG